MRVLDVGSGAGDVTFLVADLVGDTGDDWSRLAVSQALLSKGNSSISVIVDRADAASVARVGEGVQRVFAAVGDAVPAVIGVGVQELVVADAEGPALGRLPVDRRDDEGM